MAQLNPNFEIDFNDINSYEQIQLIKDTQLAKENLLMHRAYKEPAEDEIIRNQFSSFTFVDFCPKLFTTESVGGTSSPGSLSRANSRPSSSARMANNNIQECGERLDYQRDPHGQAPVSSPTLSRGSKSLRQHNYELETFSDLFDRINAWLKLNKDWRVVSMETLIFDCTSQFNHLKSSIQSSYLPKNMRGLRLYLSPSKSRFSGPQKIGCINVIPRKISGRYRSAGGGAVNEEEPLQYENLDQILARLNELLLTRPIEGRILSVETITLPIVDGYVNTETNYFMDNRLNLLNESIYTHANTFGTSTGTSSGASSGGGGGAAGPAASCQATGEQRTVDGVDRETAAGVQHEPIVAQQAANNWVTNRLRGGLDGSGNQSSHGLIDILRVYYEFGSMVCGLVNLIDFLPRLHRNQQQPAAMTGFESDHLDTPASATMDEQQQQAAAAAAAAASGANSTGIESSESLTRLVKRSLAWFELERKRIMHETSRRSGGSAAGENTSDDDDDDDDDDDGDDDDDDDDAEGNNANASGVSWRNQHRKVDLKVCNLQVHHKIMLKGQLAKVSPQNVFETVRTRQMYHEPPREPIVCQQCQLSSAMHHVREWCQHLLNLDQAYELKFVRLAYVVPVYNKYAASRLMSVYAPQPPWPRSAPSSSQTVAAAGAATALPTTSKLNDDSAGHDETAQLESGAPRLDPSGEAATGAGSSSPAGIDLINDLDNNDDVDGDENDEGGGEDDENEDDDDDDDSDDDSGDDDEDDDLVAMEGALMEARDAAERLAKEASLEIVRSTNERQRASELALQLGSGDEDEQSSLIGQLTYRLFAPCQLVNSSSCFSINPVNSSSPLSRRGSVNLTEAAPVPQARASARRMQFCPRCCCHPQAPAA